MLGLLNTDSWATQDLALSLAAVACVCDALDGEVGDGGMG